MSGLHLRQRLHKGFETVLIGEDPSIGFIGIIAVCSTRLGPSLGGIRMRPYDTFKHGLQDALSLAKAMSLKAAVSQLELGGGKAVIFGKPDSIHKTRYLDHLAVMINQLGGRYIAAEDSGIQPRDLNYLKRHTTFVTGATPRYGGSGDPSPATAWGIHAGMLAGWSHLTGEKSLRHKKIWIQGCGKVGGYLCVRLIKNGATVYVSDIDPKKVRHLVKTYGAKGVTNQKATAMTWDIFSPCGFGGVLNHDFIDSLKCGLIAGGANNQFHDQRRDSVRVMKKGICHAPDFVINAGGLMHLYAREIKNENSLKPYIDTISTTLRKIFKMADIDGKPPIIIAERLAAALLRQGGNFH